MSRPPPRLLVIDDDPTLARAVSAIARDAYPDDRELVIETVVGAEAAIHVMRRMHAAGEEAVVIVSDFHLPPSQVDGAHILLDARHRIPTAKRVLMTGREPSELVDLVTLAEPDAFVAKPFGFAEMDAVIRKLVGEVVRETSAAEA